MDLLYYDAEAGEMMEVEVGEGLTATMILVGLAKPATRRDSNGKRINPYLRIVTLLDGAGREYTMTMSIGDPFSVTPGYDDASLRGYDLGDEPPGRQTPRLDAEAVGAGARASRQDVLAKVEAFADPRVAELATFTTTGRKTRARFYKHES